MALAPLPRPFAERAIVSSSSDTPVGNVRSTALMAVTEKHCARWGTTEMQRTAKKKKKATGVQKSKWRGRRRRRGEEEKKEVVRGEISTSCWRRKGGGVCVCGQILSTRAPMFLWCCVFIIVGVPASCRGNQGVALTSLHGCTRRSAH